MPDTSPSTSPDDDEHETAPARRQRSADLYTLFSSRHGSDPLDAARGCVNALLISIPLWTAIILLVRYTLIWIRAG